MPSGGGGHGGGGGGGAHGGGKGHAHHEEHEEHEEHVNHEAWVIPYADMLTLLMVMFLALFAVGRVDSEKFKQLSENLKSDFGGGSQLVSVGSGGNGSTPLEGGEGIFDGSRPPEVAAEVSDAQKAEIVNEAAEKAAQEAVDNLGEFQKALTTESNIAGLGQGLDFRLEGRGLVVTVLSDAVLFAPGASSIEPRGFELLGVVVEALKLVPNDVVIEGHTDSRPISTSRFPSNWELSTGRATSVLQFFAASGIAVDRLAAVGYGETRPAAGNDTLDGQARNRRVEVVVLTDVSLEPILAAVDPAAGASTPAPGEAAPPDSAG